MKEWKAVNKSFDEALWQSECSERKKKITGKNDAKELLNRINRKDINYNIFIIYGDFNKQSRTHTEEKKSKRGTQSHFVVGHPFSHKHTHTRIKPADRSVALAVLLLFRRNISFMCQWVIVHYRAAKKMDQEGEERFTLKRSQILASNTAL